MPSTCVHCDSLENKLLEKEKENRTNYSERGQRVNRSGGDTEAK